MNTHLSSTKSDIKGTKFKDMIERGDDFFKIELWRPAKSWYKKALDLNMESQLVREKIRECDRQIAYELKIIRIIVAVVIVLVLGIVLF